MATKSKKKRKMLCNDRCKRQWVMSMAVFPILATGWYWPLLGFIVPITMLTGMIGGLSGGRWVCGNLCPRGSFWDRQFSLALKNERPSPKWLKNLAVRWAIFAFMIGFMLFRASANFTSVEHWGRVFWLMCAVTTGIGVAGGFVYHRRFWCTFCPIGTFAATASGHKNQLTIDDTKCVSCRLCNRACPIGVNPEQYRSTGRIADRDCLRCKACVPQEIDRDSRNVVWQGPDRAGTVANAVLLTVMKRMPKIGKANAVLNARHFRV